jgi:hypothetical protein
MKIPVRASLALLTCLMAWPACATSEHDYGKTEYLTIRHGRAPSGQLSLASHGAGTNNDDAFHVWLMAEPARRKLMALDDISSDNNLDTDPDAYHAFWSKDSRRVGVAFRSDRHEVTLNLYRIEGGRAHLLSGPSLFREVTSRDTKSEDGLRTFNSIVEWHGGNRFLLREFRMFVAGDDSLAKLFGRFGRVSDKLDGGRVAIEFYADAECEVLPSGRYRVVDLRPGKPGDADDWWDK